MRRVWYRNNDNFLLIHDEVDRASEVDVRTVTGIVNRLTGEVITGGTGSSLLEDAATDDPIDLGGGASNPVAVTEISDRAGVYVVYVSKDADFIGIDRVRATTIIEGPHGESYNSIVEIAVQTRK